MKADLILNDSTVEKIIPLTDGSVSKIDENADEVIDAAGLIAAPGLVDVHVHFRDPGFTAKEDIHTGAAAAARGGYTSVVMMGNTDPRCDNPETLEYMQKKYRNPALYAGKGIRRTHTYLCDLQCHHGNEGRGADRYPRSA